MRFQQILVPLDFSSHSAKALDVAIELAKQFKGRIHLLHSYPIYVGAVSPYGIVLPESFDRDCREAAQREIGKWSDKVNAAGVPVETTVTPSPPVEAIERLATEIDADLVVMGSRGLTGLKHVLLGSVAERTLRTCPCPVLTVKDDDAK
jgi:nucleotide-binding universal stress UspA family protein